MATEAKLKTLLAWLDTNEIKWDKKNLEIRLSNGSFGVFALRDLSDRQPCKYPLCCWNRGLTLGEW